MRWLRWFACSALVLLLVGCGLEPRAAEEGGRPEGAGDRGSLSGEGVESSAPEAPAATEDTESRGGTAPREVPAELRRAMSPRGPTVASSPRQLARQLEAAETALADPDATSDQVAAAGHLQQVAYL